jgi:hypothetical protein
VRPYSAAPRSYGGGSLAKEDRNIEVTVVLPHQDVPLRLAAPDDLSAPGGPEERVPDRQSPGWCPGPGTVYLGRTFESPELVFVRSLEVDA